MEQDNFSYAKRNVFGNKYKKTKIFGILFLFVSILLTINFVSAVYNLNQGPGFDSGASQTPQGGFKFTMKQDAILLNVSLDATVTSTCTTAYLLDSGKNVLATSTMINKNASFNYKLLNGTTYYVSCDSGGAAYGITYLVCGCVSFPIDLTSITIIGGLFQGVDSTGYTSNVQSIITFNFTQTINLPANNSYHHPTQNVTFNTTVINDNGVSTNVTLFINNVLNETKTITGKLNSTTFDKIFPVGNYSWYILSCDSTTSLCDNSSVRNFISSSAIFNSVTYNTSTYETQGSENFILNISGDGGLPLAANLTYNGTTYAAINIGDNISGIFNKTITNIALTGAGAINRSFYWTYYYGTAATNSSFYNQTINPINFTRCNFSSPIYNVTYFNVTYKDEMAYFPINASPSATSFNYWLSSGTGAVTKNFYYVNLSETEATEFCFYPSDKPITINYIYQASSVGYITRTFNSIVNFTFSNSIVNQLFYLIKSTDAGPVTIQVVDLTSANVIPNARVTITRQIQGSTVTVSDGYTDAAGTVAVYLSSLVSYTITVSKTGCGTNTQTITPVGSYNMQLNCASNITEFTSFIDGVIYQRTPLTGVSIVPGNTTFSYYVSSTLYPIKSSKFELRDLNGALLAVNQTDVSSGYAYCNATSCLTTIRYYTASGDNIKGRYYVNLGNQTNNTYVLLEKDAYWRYIYINTNNSQQSWTRATSHFQDFMDVWTGGNAQTNCIMYKTNATCTANPVCKWLNRTEWDSNPPTYEKTVEFCMLKDDVNKMEFNRVLVIFFALVIVLFIMGRGIGYEMTNPGSFVLFLSITILILSIGGMFTFSGLTPWTWFNQYIYAYICLTFAAGYNLSIIRRYSA